MLTNVGAYALGAEMSVASLLIVIVIAAIVLVATHKASTPKRTEIFWRFLRGCILLIIILSVFSQGNLDANYFSILIFPFIEEAIRLYCFGGFSKGNRPSYLAASYVAILFAVFELNNLIILWHSGDVPADLSVGLTAEIYLTIAFPIHFLMDFIGHALFGFLMIRLWKLRVIRYLAPVVMHASVNSLQYVW